MKQASKQENNNEINDIFKTETAVPKSAKA